MPTLLSAAAPSSTGCSSRNAGGATVNVGAGQIEEAYGDAGADVLDALGATWSVALAGAAGADTLIGGAGDDWIYFDGADAVVSGGAGYDRVFVRDAGGATLNLGAGQIEEATGDAGVDVLNASGTTWNVKAGRRCWRRYPDWWHRCRFSLRQQR